MLVHFVKHVNGQCLFNYIWQGLQKQRKIDPICYSWFTKIPWGDWASLFLFTVLHTFPNSCQFSSHLTSPSEAASVSAPPPCSPEPKPSILSAVWGRRKETDIDLWVVFLLLLLETCKMLITSIVVMTKKHFSTSKRWLNASRLVKVSPLCSKSCHRHWDGLCPCGGPHHRLSGWRVRRSSGLYCWNMFEHQLHRLPDAALIKQNGPAPGPSGQASTWQLRALSAARD